MEYLYGLTIQGIQSYIFNTNKLKEIIGASEIIESICTKLLAEILDNDSFDEENVLLAAAGNIKYRFKDVKNAENVYEQMPKKIIALAGNISFSQAIIKIDGTKGITSNHFIALDKQLKANRNEPINPFAQVLMSRRVERRTGEPVFKVIRHKNETEYQDLTTDLKLKSKGATLLLDKIKSNDNWSFPIDISEITNDKNKNYVAIIHADGNKLGVTIQKIIIDPTIKDKTNVLKELSRLIEESTKQAFAEAFDAVIIKDQNFERKKDDEEQDIAPLRPVILGGDDITLIIRADLAVAFTNAYLKAFEDATKENFKSLQINALADGLTATAGIVFIKEKYPFHYGVTLAESICSYAKKFSNRAHSCLKFYKVQDSFVADFNAIVKYEYSPNGYDFNKAPYTIEEVTELLQHVKALKSDKISTGAIRELLTIMYKNKDKDKAAFRWERIKEINGLENLKDIGMGNNELKDNRNIYDIITLDSLTTDN